ncbi:bifunctional DNA primase/polymerase [Streptomyces sp. SL13]|uniref:Bifunctional DNA primase/polymerase n=1 Tax=Streptantibioticus silvisoli TaxID=2705255 RepID=A0AA90GUU9_9ACTN|nr:bifunctional DNA primase/polymerase [Streptantibioticus silvisoli]MDI5968478.1 bifunctional DNA primase/polymerase [Streptantibioticus silvisoli]
MVFTIGSLRGMRAGAPGARRRVRGSICSLVAEYTGLHGWTVTPGARVRRDGACDCGDPCCAAPGAHPLGYAPRIPAGTRREEVAEAWGLTPDASVLLAAGRGFDVLDVAEQAGCRALVRLERMGLRLGPVLATPDGRALFFVAPGAAAELPRLLYRMGWDDAGLDLRCLGRGDHVTAPPSDLGALGPVRWLRPPSPDRQPPEARLLLGTLAYVCHRHGSLVRS